MLYIYTNEGIQTGILIDDRYQYVVQGNDDGVTYHFSKNHWIDDKLDAFLDTEYIPFKVNLDPVELFKLLKDIIDY